MKIYLDLLSGSEIPKAYSLDTANLMAMCGGNTGNLVFRHALAQIVDLSEYTYSDYQVLIRLLDQGAKPTSLLLSAANWVGATPQYEAQSKFRAGLIERCDCPVTIVGLGAQSPSSQAKLAIGPETTRFLKVLGQRAHLIGVRDQFTADILNEVGVTNLSIAGCPSNYISTDPNLGGRVATLCQQASKAASWTDLRVAISEFSGGNALAGQILRLNFEHLMNFGGFYVCQSPILLPFLFRESTSLPKPYADVQVTEGQAIENSVRRTAIHFSSVPSWMDFLRTCDVSFGMRIHGAMMALQSGVPSLLIGHDSRTEGLANTMRVPTVDISEFHLIYQRGPAAVYEAIRSRLGEYDAARIRLARRYLEIFSKPALRVRDEFSTFANSEVA